jgi:hypothetical protein
MWVKVDCMFESDEAVLALSLAGRAVLVSLWCRAMHKNGFGRTSSGTLPASYLDPEICARMIGARPSEYDEVRVALAQIRDLFLEPCEGGYAIRNWSRYQGNTSTERVRKHRANKESQDTPACNVKHHETPGNVSETLHETPGNVSETLHETPLAVATHATNIDRALSNIERSPDPDQGKEKRASLSVAKAISFCEAKAEAEAEASQTSNNKNKVKVRHQHKIQKDKQETLFKVKHDHAPTLEGSSVPSQPSARTVADDARDLADYLRDKMADYKPDMKIPSAAEVAGWANDIRLMIVRDKRDPNHIAAIIEWATHDEFWARNVRCGSKLRKQFDKLDLDKRKIRKQAEALPPAATRYLDEVYFEEQRALLKQRGEGTDAD